MNSSWYDRNTSVDGGTVWVKTKEGRLYLIGDEKCSSEGVTWRDWDY
jgi:hypothetical protein